MEEQKTSNYIFPNIMGSAMNKVSPKVQYESSMMGSALILVSIFMTAIYYTFFANVSLFWKFFTIFNSVAGFLMISSMLVTTYQQYQQYMGAVALQKALGVAEQIEPINPSKIKRTRMIVAVIEILIITAVGSFISLWFLILVIHPIYLLITTNSYIKKMENKQ